MTLGHDIRAIFRVQGKHDWLDGFRRAGCAFITTLCAARPTVISIAMAAQRTFTFPADLATTTAYFRAFKKTIQSTPYLHLVKTYARNKYRILYSATEASVYRVAFFCDIQLAYDETRRLLRVTPLTGIPPVPTRLTFDAVTGQGDYWSQSVFQPAGARTRVRNGIKIMTRLPKRPEMVLVPDLVVKRLVEGLMKRRMQEIMDAMIAGAIEELQP